MISYMEVATIVGVWTETSWEITWSFNRIGMKKKDFFWIVGPKLSVNINW